MFSMYISLLQLLISTFRTVTIWWFSRSPSNRHKTFNYGENVSDPHVVNSAFRNPISHFMSGRCRWTQARLTRYCWKILNNQKIIRKCAWNRTTFLQVMTVNLKLETCVSFLTALKSMMKRVTFEKFDCSSEIQIVQLCSEFFAGQTVTSILISGAEFDFWIKKKLRLYLQRSMARSNKRDQAEESLCRNRY